MSYERPNIAAMQGYISGEQPEDPEAIKLNTNENPYPPAPEVAKVIATFNADALRRYPPPTADDFRDAAAVLHGLSRDHLLATRGGDELLRLVITTFVAPGAAIGTTDPTYSLYKTLAEVQDCPVISIPLHKESWQLPSDFPEQMNDAGVALTLLVNPHAPTGLLISHSHLKELANRLDGLLLIDEAYVDFVDPNLGYDAVSLVHELDNVIILRSLSKGYSLAGLRFGYGIASPELIRPMLVKTKDSYNLDLLSQKVALAAINNQSHAAETWTRVRSERNRLVREFTALNLPAAVSETNFLLISVSDIDHNQTSAEQLYRGLKSQGVFVRYFSDERLRDKLRVTIGTPEENDRLIHEIKSILVQDSG